MTKHNPDSAPVQDASSAKEVVPVGEEVLHIDKTTVTTGKVRVRTVTDVVSELAQASLDTETVEVTRVPVNRVVDHAPDIRTENGATIVPVLEEILVVEKRLVLKEELHIRKRLETENVEVPVELRKQHAVVERNPLDDKKSDSSA